MRFRSKPGPKEITISGYFTEGDVLTDHYSGQKVRVTQDKVKIDSNFDIVLLAKQ